MKRDKFGNVAYSDSSDTIENRIAFLRRALKDDTFEGDKDIVKIELIELLLEIYKELN